MDWKNGSAILKYWEVREQDKMGGEGEAALGEKVLAGWGQVKVLLETQICPAVTDQVEKVQDHRAQGEGGGRTGAVTGQNLGKHPCSHPFRKWKRVIKGDQSKDEKLGNQCRNATKPNFHSRGGITSLWAYPPDDKSR